MKGDTHLDTSVWFFVNFSRHFSFKMPFKNSKFHSFLNYGLPRGFFKTARNDEFLANFARLENGLAMTLYPVILSLANARRRIHALNLSILCHSWILRCAQYDKIKPRRKSSQKFTPQKPTFSAAFSPAFPSSYQHPSPYSAAR